jgi:hypothetical protein
VKFPQTNPKLWTNYRPSAILTIVVAVAVTVTVTVHNDGEVWRTVSSELIGAYTNTNINSVQPDEMTKPKEAVTH